MLVLDSGGVSRLSQRNRRAAALIGALPNRTPGVERHAPATRFGRLHHLPATQIAAVIDGLRRRGLIGDDGWLTDELDELVELLAHQQW